MIVTGAGGIHGREKENSSHRKTIVSFSFKAGKSFMNTL